MLDAEQGFSDFYSNARPGVPDGLTSTVSGAFGLLMSTPMEYVTRKARSDLIRRAQAADVALSAAARPEDTLAVILLREFLKRALDFVGSVEHVVSCISLFKTAGHLANRGHR